VGVSSRAIFDDCTFDPNEASAEGGGLYCYMVRDYGDENRSGVVVRNCEFSENQASGSGGAISTYNSDRTGWAQAWALARRSERGFQAIRPLSIGRHAEIPIRLRC